MIKTMTGALLIALGLALSGPAVAAESLLALKVDGDSVKAADRAAMDARVLAGLKAYKDLTLVARPDVDVMDLMIDNECIDLDGPCFGRIGAGLGAARVLYIEVVKGAAGLTGTLRWVTVQSQTMDRVDTVEAPDVAAMGEALASALQGQLGAPPPVEVPVTPPPVEVPVATPSDFPAADAATLIVETNRIQAQIFIGDEYAGTGTATIERPAGKYTLRITHPGDETQVVSVELQAGETTTRQVTLRSALMGGAGESPLPPAPKDADEGGSDWVIWVVLGAVAVAAIATTVALTSGSGSSGPSGPGLVLGLEPSGAWRDNVTHGGRR